jgi:hypothetical protein
VRRIFASWRRIGRDAPMMDVQESPHLVNRARCYRAYC